MATAITCPKCEKGELVRKESTKYPGSFFYGCSRFRNGCRFIANVKQYQQLLNGQKIIDNAPRSVRRYTPPVLPRGPSYPHLIEGTPEQQAIWEHVLEGRNVIVDALAGTGKSTVLVQMCARAGEDCFILIVAFNRRVSEEIIPKLPPNASSLTLHKVGFIACQEHYGRLNATKYKSNNMLSDHYGLQNITDKQEFLQLTFNIRTACEIISHCKTSFYPTPSLDDINTIISKHGIDVIDYGQVCEMVQHVMSCCGNEDIVHRYSVDFDDMIYLPVLYNFPVIQADAVAVDEAQDFSRTKQLLAIRISDQRLVVGDKNQAIYHFSGASCSGMSDMAELIQDVVRLPLTVNWRCGKKHIQLAQVIVPEIQAHANAPEGYIYEINEDDFLDTVKPGDMVLCRTNAPMLKRVYALLKRGIGATIAGKDIGEDLINIIMRQAGITPKDKTCTMRLPTLIQKLQKYQDDQVEKLAARRNSEMLIEQFNDKMDMLRMFCEHSQSVMGLISQIESMFTEVGPGEKPNLVVFYTVHKAKGAECKRVFIIEPALLPYPKARTEEDKQQELNLLYVALTRILALQSQASSGKLHFVGAMPELIRKDLAHLIDPFIKE